MGMLQHLIDLKRLFYLIKDLPITDLFSHSRDVPYITACICRTLCDLVFMHVKVVRNGNRDQSRQVWPCPRNKGEMS